MKLKASWFNDERAFSSNPADKNAKQLLKSECLKSYYNNHYDYGKDIRAYDPKRLQSWLQYLINFVPLKEIKYLDVGCGIGVNLLMPYNFAWQVYGVDICDKAITYAQANLPPEIKLQVADGESLPYPDQYFDIVVALGSIEHFNNPGLGVVEIERVLKPDGYAVISVPNKPIIENLGLYHGTEQPQELRLTKNGWRDVIESCGLIVKSVKRDYGPRVFKDYKPLKILQRLAIKLTRFLPDCFTYQWIYNCRKEA